MSYIGDVGRLDSTINSDFSKYTYEYIATEGQTVFTGTDINSATLGYTAGNVLVTYGGLDIPQSDYTATDGVSIVLTDPAIAGEIVRVIAFQAFEVADAYTKIQADDLLATKAPLASPSFTGNVGIGNSDPATPLDVRKAGGGNFIANFQNTTAGTPYGVSIKDAVGGASGYPLLQVTNSAGSAAYFKVNSGNEGVYVGGNINLSANDTYVGFPSNGIYYNNSADIISVKTAAVERMRIDSGGRVTTPYQPAFLARIPNSVAITANGWAKFNFNATAWDRNNNFSTANARFTAPVSGVYYFNWLVQIQNITTLPTWYYAYPLVNSSTSAGSNGVTFADQTPTSTTFYGIKGSQSLNLVAGDYVELQYFWSGGNGNIIGGTESQFSGHLIG